MLSTFARLLLALTTLSPVALTWALADFSRSGFALSQLCAVAVAVLFALVCWLLLHGSAKILTEISFVATEIKSIDNEAVAFVLTYLAPLLSPPGSVSQMALALVFLLLGFLLSSTHAFTFNPLLAILGYHFYEVKNNASITYIVISKGPLTNLASITKVARISNFLLLDVSS